MQLQNMLGRLLLVALAACLQPLAGAGLGAATYFVDCDAGDDAASGLTEASAWSSVERVNQQTFAPGDSILFRRGTACFGSLRPGGSGSPDAPIVLGAYGTGVRPLIDGGNDTAAIELVNQEYWQIRSLETRGGNPFGIHITGDVEGILNHFRIQDVWVHDVGGFATNKESGLIVVTPGSAATAFNDVIIDGATAHGTMQWAGILVGGDDFGATPSSLRSTNVIVRNSTVHDVAGDGIILYQVDNGLLEANVAFDTGKAETAAVGTPNGIWTWMCGDCTVQYNEGYLTDSPGVDGGVFDIDYGCSNNIVQYNYAHDAAGYCVSVFGAYWPTTNSIVRYNVCANNGRDPSKTFQGDIYLTTWNGGTIDGVQIYNNTVYWDPAGSGPAFNVLYAQLVGEGPRLFKNNIVHSTTPGLVSLPTGTGMELSHNLYWYAGAGSPFWVEGATPDTNLQAWQVRGHDANSGFANPQLVGSTAEGNRPPAMAFGLRHSSPAIDAGTEIEGMPAHDFTRRSVPYGDGYDIGAVEWRPRQRCLRGDGEGWVDCTDLYCAGSADLPFRRWARCQATPREIELTPRDR